MIAATKTEKTRRVRTHVGDGSLGGLRTDNLRHAGVPGLTPTTTIGVSSPAARPRVHLFAGAGRLLCPLCPRKLQCN